MYKRIVAALILLFFCKSGECATQNFSPSADQQISDFSLAGYGERGKKTWDISGKSADIFNEVVRLQDIVGNMYGEKENIRLIADSGNFNKASGNVHLEKNVVITTSSGAKMTTDTLDWDRKANIVKTLDQVNLERDSMTGFGQGATGEPSLNRVRLEKDIKINIDGVSPAAGAGQPKQKIVITCDGPLEIDYANSVAVFRNNVKVENQDSLIQSDIMDVYFSKGASQADEPVKGGGADMASKIDRIVARGNVKITRGENISYSEEAVYNAGTRKITLSGAPRLVIYSTEGLSNNASAGN